MLKRRFTGSMVASACENGFIRNGLIEYTIYAMSILSLAMPLDSNLNTVVFVHTRASWAEPGQDAFTLKH